MVEVDVGFERYFASRPDLRRGPAGDIVLYEDAYRNVALAINQGNAPRCRGGPVGQDPG